MRFTSRYRWVGLLVGLNIGMGCTEFLSNHCANASGDQTCVDRGMGSFCDACSAAADGCTAVRPTGDCHFEGPGQESDPSNPSTSTNDDGVMTAETTPDPNLDSSVTSGTQPCSSDEDCGEAAAPFCGPSGVCVACDQIADADGACVGLDPAVPVCVNGECAECTTTELDACGGYTPVCDDDSNACVACSDHDQCGEAACNFYTGACLPANAVVHVGVGLDFGSLATAVESFGMGTEGTIIVHAGVYFESIAVTDGRTLAFLANEADLPVWGQDVGGPHLWVHDDSIAILDGLSMPGVLLFEVPAEPALRVSGARAWVDRSHLVNNAGGGILIEGGADVTIRNSFIGGRANGVNALEVNDSSASILYSTLIAGRAGAVALSCSSPTSVVVRNSLIAAHKSGPGSGLDVACDRANITFSATESAISGMGNQMFGNIPASWFEKHGSGDFHLRGDGLTELANIAPWQSGDPPTDIDGNPRPSVDGIPDYPGADRP